MIEFKHGNMRQRLALLVSSPWLVTLLALFVAESLFLIMKIQGVRLSGPVIPVTLGLIKDLADVVIVVLVPWHGWVFAIPLSILLMFDSGIKKLITVFLISTTATSVISSVFSFSDLSVKKIATGILTYSAINLFVFLLLLLLKSSIKGVLKCRR